MKKYFATLILISLLTQCIPQEQKEQMNEGFAQMQLMLAKDAFQHAVAMIELHKLRNGNYPGSLSEIRFIPAMDSASLASVQYQKLPEGYELNMTISTSDINGNIDSSATMNFPAEFWNGLGCIKSNLKKE